MGNTHKFDMMCDVGVSEHGAFRYLHVLVRFDFDMCFGPQRRALFRHLNFQKWSENGVFWAL